MRFPWTLYTQTQVSDAIFPSHVKDKWRKKSRYHAQAGEDQNILLFLRHSSVEYSYNNHTIFVTLRREKLWRGGCKLLQDSIGITVAVLHHEKNISHTLNKQGAHT